MANGWTPEQRARQAELIRTWRPREKATGPTIAEDKAVSSRNAYAGGFEQQLRELRAVMRCQRERLE